jgi:hypothetical protein
MTSCNECNALVGAPAKVEPHAALQMEASIETLSGSREQFRCRNCKQTLIRFKATQTSPPPSDVWRWG